MTDSFIFGLDVLSIKAVLENCLTVGSVGSGKTLIIERSMFSLLKGSGYRSLVYDPKLELLPVLAGLGRWEDVRILNPFDARSYCYDIAEDFEDPVAARQFANLLIPDNAFGKDDGFWIQASREMVYGVITSLILCAREKSFTFADVIRGCLSKPYLKFFLEQEKTRSGVPFYEGTRIRDSFLEGDDRLIKNLMSSLGAYLGVYAPLAAAWQKSYEGSESEPARRFCFKNWIKGNELAVLGNDESARAAIDPINRILISRAVEITLSQDDLKPEQVDLGENFTFFWFDEIREAGRLDSLPRLLLKGRSKGASVFLGLQSNGGLSAVYSPEVAAEMLGQFGCIGVLRLNDPTTAMWASDVFGRAVVDSKSKGTSSSNDGMSRSAQISEVERHLIQSAEFLYLPKTNKENGLTGYFRNSYRRVSDGFRDHIDWDPDISQFLAQRSTERAHRAFEPRDKRELYLLPFTKKDWARLGFAGDPPELHPQEQGWS